MRQKPHPRKVKSNIQLNQYLLLNLWYLYFLTLRADTFFFFFKLKLVECMGSDRGRPEGTSDHYAAHRSHSWGEPGSLGADIHTHNEIFDLTQGSVKKKKSYDVIIITGSVHVSFFFWQASPFFLSKQIHMDQKGWLFNVTISTFAVLCHNAFNAHCSVSADGWHPYFTIRVWSFEAAFHSHLFIKEPDWIWRTKTTCY